MVDIETKDQQQQQQFTGEQLPFLIILETGIFRLHLRKLSCASLFIPYASLSSLLDTMS